MATDWTTPAEHSHYRTTPRYAETMAWFERLTAAAPQLKLFAFGTTPEGRELKYLVAAKDGEFTPAAAQASGKQILFVQAGIHPGEIEGKDAGMALLRDLTVAHKFPLLLDHTIIVYLPIFNVDGHERSGPFNRVNQNGPEEMGWRATAQNLNLNRDYVKADTPEMRAWLKLFNAWQPDLFIDVHTTDGADYQYDLTWYLEEWDNQHPAVRAWQQAALIERVFPAVERHGHLLAPYLELIDHRDITKGLANFGSGPRYSTGYLALRNRPGLLLETHMLKDYQNRVTSTYDLLAEVLRELNRDSTSLRAAVRAAEADTIARAARTDASVPLQLKTREQPESFKLKGYAFSHSESTISGDQWVHYDPHKPRIYEVPFFRQLEIAKAVTPPAAYLIPPAWLALVSERLDAHGIRWQKLAAPQRIAVERYRLSEPQWASSPFEGRLALRSFKSAVERDTIEAPAGSALVALDQSGANVAIHLLEPEAPDSLLRWGEFDAIFEHKETPDARVAEQIARDLLKKHPEMQAEFDARLADPAFAKDPTARLLWFFDRSQYADPKRGLYPIARVGAGELARLRAAN